MAKKTKEKLTKRKKKKQELSGFRRFLRHVKLALLILFVLALISPFVFYTIVLKPYEVRASKLDLSLIDELERPSLILDRTGREIGRMFIENRSLIPIEKVPEDLIDALLAQEDQRFWEHNGVDWVGVFRAVYLNLKAGETTQGASTITMQLARNAFDLQADAKRRNERGLQRKIVEAFLSSKIENKLVGKAKGAKRLQRKLKILERYLNRVPFGSGYYGVRSAALGYFGKEPQDLSLEECASLVACIKNPSYFNPLRHPKTNKKHRDHVFNRMLQDGKITQEQYEKLCSKEVKVNPKPLRRGTSHLYEKVAVLTREYLGEEAMSRGGFHIHTTIDKEVQERAQQSLTRQLKKIENTPGYTHSLYANYKRGENTSPKYLQGAILMVNTKDKYNKVGDITGRAGDVLAHVGGRDYRHSQYDFIESGRRPLGTAFLPVVYAAAFENNLSPAHIVSDEPLDAREVGLGGAEGILGEWGMEIENPTYEGSVTARHALAKSKLAATVQLGNQVGFAEVREQALALGMSLASDKLLPRFLLGWETSSLPEAVSAYAAFANKGKLHKNLIYISRIEDVEGNVVYPNLKEGDPSKKQQKAIRACDERVAYQVSSILKSTLKKGYLKDEASRLEEVDKCVVKTGTNHDFTDAWALGSNGRVTCGVWVGFLQGRNAIIDNGFARKISLPIWASVMNQASQTHPGIELNKPKDMKRVKVCSESGRGFTRYCYVPVVSKDEDKGIVLQGTGYWEYLRGSEARLGPCPLHGGEGLANSKDYSAETINPNVGRRLSVQPIIPKNKGLTGIDPYGSDIIDINENGLKDIEERVIPTNLFGESYEGEKEATILLEFPPRLEMPDE